MAATKKPVTPEEPMKLQIWAGGWGLPSVDPASLQCLANIRFAGVPVKVEECNNPWRSPRGTIPWLQVGQHSFFSPNEVSSYLRSQNFSADYGLSSVECAETLAYMEYVWDTLQIAYQYFAWVHPQNFDDLVRPFYGKRLPWLYKMWYPEKLRKRALGIVSTVYRELEQQQQQNQIAERFIIQKTQSCLKTLSDKLGSNEFFMGKSAPTTIDSVVFSYLSFFWKVPISHNPVREMLKYTPNLETYLARILQRYFPSSSTKKLDGPLNSSANSSRVIYGMDGDVVSPEGSQEYPLSHKIFAITFTSLLMLWYGYRNRIVRIPRLDAITSGGHHDEEEEDEYWEE